MPDLSNSLYGLFAGGGILSVLGVLLTNRSGRQRAFDERVDRALSDAEVENRRLEGLVTEFQSKLRASEKECRDNEAASEAEIRTLQLETVRLRRLLIEAGIDPDPSIKGGGR